MSTYTRTYLGNLVMTIMGLAVSGYEMTVAFAGVSKVDFPTVSELVPYSVWTALFVIIAAVGIEVVKDAWKHDKEEWLASQMPPLFLEGVR